MSRFSLRHAGAAGFVVAGLAIGLALEKPRPPSSGGTPAPPIEISDLRGGTGQLATAADIRQPTVVMLSSKTCTYCKEALRDLAELAHGREAPGLWLVTLEGVQPGEQMLQTAGVAGARSFGPASSATEILLTFQTPGTPVFALLDSTGRTVRVVSGYPGREAMREWFGVMLGERHGRGPWKAGEGPMLKGPVTPVSAPGTQGG